MVDQVLAIVAAGARPCGEGWRAPTTATDRAWSSGAAWPAEEDQRRPIVDGAEVHGVAGVEDGQQAHVLLAPAGDVGGGGGEELVHRFVFKERRERRIRPPFLLFEYGERAAPLLDEGGVDVGWLAGGAEQRDQCRASRLQTFGRA